MLWLGPPKVGCHYLYYNGHGDLAAEADGSGTRTALHTYDPFGAPLDTQPANQTVHRYTGAFAKQYDTASSLILMGARPYDPSLGRFLAVDPIDGGSLNNYDYAGQDPVNGYDVTGGMDERLLDPGSEDDVPIDVDALTGPEETGNADSEEYVVCGGSCNGETPQTKLGKEMHIGLEAVYGSDYDYNVYLGPGVGYADAVSWEENTIVELKPNNPAAVRQGMAQLDRYQKALEEETGEKWHIKLETYSSPYTGRH